MTYNFTLTTSHWIGIIAFLILITVLVAYKLKGASLSEPDSKLPFNIQELIESLGGKKNIKNVHAKMSKLTIELNDVSLINPDDIKGLGATGIIKSSNKVIIVFGVISEKIASELK